MRISLLFFLATTVNYCFTFNSHAQEVTVGNFLSQTESGQIAVSIDKISSKKRAKSPETKIKILNEQSTKLNNTGKRWFYYNHISDIDRNPKANYLFALSIKHRLAKDGKQNANLQLYRNEGWVRLNHSTGKARETRKALEQELVATYNSTDKCLGLISGERSGYTPIDEFLKFDGKRQKNSLLDASPPGNEINTISAIETSFAGINYALQSCSNDPKIICECKYQLIQFDVRKKINANANPLPVLFEISTHTVNKVDLFLYSPNSPHMTNRYEIVFE